MADSLITATAAHSAAISSNGEGDRAPAEVIESAGFEEERSDDEIPEDDDAPIDHHRPSIDQPPRPRRPHSKSPAAEANWRRSSTIEMNFPVVVQFFVETSCEVSTKTLASVPLAEFNLPTCREVACNIANHEGGGPEAHREEFLTNPARYWSIRTFSS
ncbi:hypothetical protein [Nocardia miyunensis]|uniref:hypothetical protein n=1 Tax=Nocardia miyunensis TaxID=282684 RepID=UPI0012F522CA|nr:hypothetical protein [Nocardia miyunensis]